MSRRRTLLLMADTIIGWVFPTWREILILWRRIWMLLILLKNRCMHNISAGKMAYAISLRFYYPYNLIIKILSVLTSLTNNSINTSCSNHKWKNQWNCIKNHVIVITGFYLAVCRLLICMISISSLWRCCSSCSVLTIGCVVTCRTRGCTVSA